MEKISPNQIIIIGGGATIKEGMKMGLFDKLKGKCTMGLNYAFKFITPTFVCCVDDVFYEKNHYALKELPLIVMPHKNLNIFNNTIMLPTEARHYNIDIKKGVYKIMLSGLFGLSVAIYLLGNMENSEVFLLGYDYGAVGKDNHNIDLTHFYQGQLKHNGVGRNQYYCIKDKAKLDFDKYNLPERKTVIYNVSLISKIPSFSKISYEEFFSRLDDKTYNQEELRKEVIALLKPLEPTIDPKRRMKS